MLSFIVIPLSVPTEDAPGVVKPAIYDDVTDPTVSSLIMNRVRAMSIVDSVSRSLRMKPADAKALADRMFAPTTARYFEWGSGGSTELGSAAALDAARLEVHSVDSSSEWFEELRNDSAAIRLAEAQGVLSFYDADIGDTADWGNPTHWEERPESLRHTQGGGYLNAIGGY